MPHVTYKSPSVDHMHFFLPVPFSFFSSYNLSLSGLLFHPLNEGAGLADLKAFTLYNKAFIS